MKILVFVNSELLDKDNIEDAIDFFETYLENLSNFSQRGFAQRLFIFKLCDTDKEKNLNNFDALCKVKDSGKLQNVRAASNSRVQVEGGIQSNHEDLDVDMKMSLTNNKPSAEKLQKELTGLRSNYKKLQDTFQKQKEANQELKEEIKTATSNLTNALRALIIVLIPIGIGTGIIYDNVKDIDQTNNSSESRPANTNNSASNTSSSNFPDLFKHTNTDSSQSQTEKPNSESKPKENFKCR
ncbi:hypothetical protein [Nostoc sp. JL33]|uniref:hypothetical protein n=1 Tax=Nostoc sp. JL33 TaxID=2815396 RepID=UPI0025D6F482|nr:hypothetical protein [Nostoc sp. JL33]MBN3869265.1 hypothetical protein [Nostoc sp. JL33]